MIKLTERRSFGVTVGVIAAAVFFSTYDHAKGQAFYALKDGTPCGRIHAMVNYAHNERYEASDGFFGFFEAIDDQEVATLMPLWVPLPGSGHKKGR